MTVYSLWLLTLCNTYKARPYSTLIDGLCILHVLIFICILKNYLSAVEVPQVSFWALQLEKVFLKHHFTLWPSGVIKSLLTQLLDCSSQSVQDSLIFLHVHEAIISSRVKRLHQLDFSQSD